LAIGIVAEGRVQYAQGFGSTMMGDDSHPITSRTLFHLGSITKPFVATAVMQLVERNKVDLDAPICTYLPYFILDDSRAESITVRQLLTHTSGMPDVADYGWNRPRYDNNALEHYVRSIRDQTLRWAPGSQFGYSNVAYEVLGDLVAKASNVTFEEY